MLENADERGPRTTYVEVLSVDLAVLWLVEVLLRDEHTLLEEVLVDLLAVGLGNQHLGGIIVEMSSVREIREDR